jgi:Carbon-nitrogen hydrolase
MPTLRMAAVQASYVLMDRDATIDRVAALTAAAARDGAHLVVFPEVETLVLDLDLRTVAAESRLMDPVGHYNRPDVFRLLVDTSSRPAVMQSSGAPPAASSRTSPRQPADPRRPS